MKRPFYGIGISAEILFHKTHASSENTQSILSKFA